MKRHGEVLLRWKGKEYSITHYNNQISISQPYRQDTERMFNTAEELLAYRIDGVTLRDIIRQAEIIYRTI